MASQSLERVNKVLMCKHVYDSIPAKSPKILLLTCRECGVNVTAQVESYYLDPEEIR